MPKRITRRTLNKITRRLPKGWKEIIAVEVNLQPETIRKVMQGVRKNNIVLKKAIDMSQLPEEEKDQLIQLIAS